MYFKFFQQIGGREEPPKTYGIIVRCCLRKKSAFSSFLCYTDIIC